MESELSGLWGGVRSSIDQELVSFLAKKFPQDILVFVGPVQTDISRLQNVGNIIFTGQRRHDSLPAYIKRFDVCIIPYVKDAYTNNISPAKLNEYLIMGKPVVSANLSEVETFNKDNGNVLYLASNKEEFAKMISRAIAEDSIGLREQRIEVAQKNSWTNKIEEMSDIISDIIRKKEYETYLNWKSRLLLLYNALKWRIIKLAAFAGIFIIAVFYTPLMWFLGQPLKISDMPQEADAIVVFAGGVGESGKAEQGYEERVEHAVELYSKGFAKDIIFSSGYAFVYKEPLIMKALAVSLGVAQDAIILEDKAKNTYENVKLTNEILKENGWKKILLISSPYHMRRVSLVFGKIAKDISVVYSPVPESSFYAHPEKDSYGNKIWRRIRLHQLKGIMHEYLGILYYWRKGWV